MRKHDGANIRAGRGAALACALSLAPPCIGADDAAQPPGEPVVRCEIAVVNPVSGFAECVKPRGVPVAPPPAHPAPTPEQCRSHADLGVAECPDGKAVPGPSE